MTVNDVVARARSAVGQGCSYHLGAGGMRPNDPAPWNAHLQCDCSGVAMWCLGLSRFDGETWFETTRIVYDALNENLVFARVPWLHARPSDLLVYGDLHGHQGHVGVVTEATLGPETFPLLVAHCSSGNWRHTNDAIRETGPEIWTHNEAAIVARCLRLEAIA
jgi:hypothetical protein